MFERLPNEKLIQSLDTKDSVKLLASKRKNLQTILLEDLKKRRKNYSKVNLPSKELLLKIKDVPLKEFKQKQNVSSTDYSEKKTSLLDEPKNIVEVFSTSTETATDSFTSDIIVHDVTQQSISENVPTLETTTVIVFEEEDETVKQKDIFNEETTTVDDILVDELTQYKESTEHTTIFTTTPFVNEYEEKHEVVTNIPDLVDNIETTTVISDLEFSLDQRESDVSTTGATEYNTGLDTTTEKYLDTNTINTDDFQEESSLLNIFEETNVEPDNSKTLKDEYSLREKVMNNGGNYEKEIGTSKKVSNQLFNTKKPKIHTMDKNKHHSKLNGPKNREEQRMNSYLNLRGTSKYNYVKTRNPIQRNTKTSTQNYSYGQEKTSSNTPSFLSFGQKIKSVKRNRYALNKKEKKDEEQLSVINTYSFNPPTSSSQSSNPPPPSVLEESQIMEKQFSDDIIKQFSSWSSPPPLQLWSFQEASPQTHYQDEVYEDSYSPRKMDVVDVDDRGRQMLKINDTSIEDDNIGLIDYTNEDDINKPFSLGFQPPSFW